MNAALPVGSTGELHAQLVPLRALCELVGSGGPGTCAGSITVRIDAPDGAGLHLLRAAEEIAAEFGVCQRIQLHGGRGTIHIWTERSAA